MLSKSRIGFGKSIALAIAAGVLAGCPWPKSDTERFVGTWATEGQSKGMQMIFSANGTLYLVAPAAKPPLAFRGTYRLNTSVRPREIAMTLSGETGVSLYEFAGDRRVTLIQPAPAETLAPLPSSTLTKVSQATTPPPGIPLRDLNEIGQLAAQVPPSRIESSEAVKTLAAFLRKQQAYFTENAQFTDDPMRLGLTAPLDTAEYAYRIAVIDPARVSQITAIAKQDSLSGYVGAIYALESPAPAGAGASKPLKVLLCQSLQPTRTSPPPIRATNAGYACPEGYRDLGWPTR